MRPLLTFLAVWGLATTAHAQSAPSADAPVRGGIGFAARGGAALYGQSCAACHQADGRGAQGAAAYPALRDNARAASADYLLTVVLHGLRAMPPIGRMMDDAQVAAVVNYVRVDLAGGSPADPAVSAADVESVRR